YHSVVVIILTQSLFVTRHLIQIVYFFFQAEDGIRDGHVTGVQTCALPICSGPRARNPIGRRRSFQDYPPCAYRRRHAWLVPSNRSEERRVGKECRCRWVTYH